MIAKWALQTQAGAPDEQRWVEMAGSAQIGYMNERTLLLLILFHTPSPLLPLQGGFILRASQGQSQGPKYRALCPLHSCVCDILKIYGLQKDFTGH